MKNILIVIGLLTVVWLCLDTPVDASTTAKVTAKVIDENHEPIAGAKVLVGYVVTKSGGIGWSDVKVEGKSDSEGLFAAKEGTILPQVTIYAKKAGYYKSAHIEKFTGRSLLQRWEPWNPIVEVVLKKKRNPIPMYAKRTDWIKVPKLGEPVGYDLERGDWVTPYGNGVTNDLIVTLKINMRSNRDYDWIFLVTFSNEKDGIQEYFFNDQDQSSFKWPFNAPNSGYLDRLKKTKTKTPGKSTSDQKEDVNYLFRVRTKTDKDGNIVKGNYGRISEEFGISENGKINFTYYFNPDGTKNLEFDPTKNLFKWGSEDWRHEVQKP